MYIYLNVCKQMTDVKLLQLHGNMGNNLTVCKKKWVQAHLKMLSTKYLQIICIFNIYKQDLALNNLQGLICCKTKPNPVVTLLSHK